MNKVSILDCTLRDGGYINDFSFGNKIMKDIVQKLSCASIDIVECGFLRSGENSPEKSLFGSVEMIKDIIGEKKPGCLYVAMLQYGKMNIEEIAQCDGMSIDGVRLSFHEYEIDPSVELGKKLMEKGYKVFMQPVGTMAYTDGELLQLIEKINEMMPYAFYMVDTLGTMYRNDLRRMFYLVDHNLNKKILVGFHSHNNLQMSFANAQEIMQMSSPRHIIVDSSVYGMGRGAGNLNTELVVRFINTNIELLYDEIPILEILDNYIRPLRNEYQWGYDAAYYVAAAAGCHPNYASFLMNRHTLKVRDIHAILESLEKSKRHLFDKQYIAKKYEMYLSHHIDDGSVQEDIFNEIKNRKIIILAPGKSVRDNLNEILEYVAESHAYVVSVNFIPDFLTVNLTFVSNMKRFDNIKVLIDNSKVQHKIVITSNIVAKSDYKKMMIADYSSYLSEDSSISDNAGIMCINFLRRCGARDLILAGYDGFSLDWKENFFEDEMAYNIELGRISEMNKALSQKLHQLQRQMNIEFFKESLYQKEESR